MMTLKEVCELTGLSEEEIKNTPHEDVSSEEFLKLYHNASKEVRDVVEKILRS